MSYRHALANGSQVPEEHSASALHTQPAGFAAGTGQVPGHAAPLLQQIVPVLHVVGW